MQREGKMKRIFTALGLCVVMAAAPVGIVNAENTGADEAGSETQGQVIYDMETGGTQSFEILDEDGEETEIIVEEVPGGARVANGKYKITRKKKGYWTAGFCVDISGNKIVKAYNKFIDITRGSISNIKLVKESNISAKLSFVFKINNCSNGVKVRAKIINKKLTASIS